MTNATAPRKSSVKMTLRVYSVDRNGTMTEDRGTVNVSRRCERQPLPLLTSLPPCACPIHRAAGQPAVAR